MWPPWTPWKMRCDNDEARAWEGFATSTMVMFLLLGAAGPVTAQSPSKAKDNQLMIEKEAAGILFLAHPTVTLTRATYNQTTEFKNGTYALTYKFTWKNFFNDPCYRYWHFHFTKEGTIFHIEDGATDTTFKPFSVNDAVLKEIKDNIRDQMRTGKLKENDPVGKLVLEAPDVRSTTVLLLQLSQK